MKELITASDGLAPSEAQALDDDGFVVIAGPISPTKLASLGKAYDRAMREATPPDLSIGRTNTRVHDFVNRGEEFDELYVHPPILDACQRTIGQPFRLSTLAGRTLHPLCAAQERHVDFARDRDGWPMVGFIVMIDEFHDENGATCFLPGSHRGFTDASRRAEGPARVVSACGPAGSVIVYNGSVLHGHGANRTSRPRRSIQGAFIRRTAPSGVDLAARMRPETTERIGPLAKCLIRRVTSVTRSLLMCGTATCTWFFPHA